jgi:hypothetical protein
MAGRAALFCALAAAGSAHAQTTLVVESVITLSPAITPTFAGLSFTQRF